MYEECGNTQGKRRSKQHTTYCGKTNWVPFGRVMLKERKLITTILNMKYEFTLDSFSTE